MTLRSSVTVVVMCALLEGIVAAQTASPSQAAQVSAPTPAVAQGKVALPPAYDSAGRRDPFVSLVMPAKKDATPTATANAANAVEDQVANASSPANHPVGTGLASILVKDASVKGILRSGSTLLAILQTADGRTFNAKVQDRLRNGSVKSIEPDAVVFTENIADSQGSPRVHDVRRLLHPTSGGGQ